MAVPRGKQSRKAKVVVLFPYAAARRVEGCCGLSSIGFVRMARRTTLGAATR